MTILFKPILRKHPAKPEEKPLYYASAVARGTVDLNHLANLMADGSTVRRADVYAVLLGATDLMLRLLAQGQRVTLGELGSFVVHVSSAGYPEQEQVIAPRVTKSRIIFRPSSTFKQSLSALRFEKAAPQL